MQIDKSHKERTQVFPFDFDELLIRCLTDENKKHVLFYTCPIKEYNIL